MKTAACTKLGIDFPIVQAPMQGAVGPRLAAAVSNAGQRGLTELGAMTELVRKATISVHLESVSF